MLLVVPMGKNRLLRLINALQCGAKRIDEQRRDAPLRYGAG